MSLIRNYIINTLFKFRGELWNLLKNNMFIMSQATVHMDQMYEVLSPPQSASTHRCKEEKSLEMRPEKSGHQETDMMLYYADHVQQHIPKDWTLEWILLSHVFCILM